MAEFKVEYMEGMQYVDVHLNNETVRVEAGALSYLKGDITVHSELIPSIKGLITSLLADESIYRPTYTGTGIITLESSLGGFHVIELKGESWILERGAYWASEGRVNLSFHRENLMTSIWAGEGLVYLQTKVAGYGKVVVTTRGPIEEHVLGRGERLVAEGMYVIARTPDVKFKIKRPTKNYFGRFTSGEHFVRVFEGPGKVLLNPAPYWRYWMMTQKHGGSDFPSQATF